jgi:hypothetical protein
VIAARSQHQGRLLAARAAAEAPATAASPAGGSCRPRRSHVGINAARQQCFDNGDIALLRGQVERRIAGAVARGHVRAAFE